MVFKVLFQCSTPRHYSRKFHIVYHIRARVHGECFFNNLPGNPANASGKASYGFYKLVVRHDSACVYIYILYISIFPSVKRNWGKQRTCYHAFKDWNALDSDLKNSDTICQFKSNFFLIY